MKIIFLDIDGVLNNKNVAYRIKMKEKGDKRGFHTFAESFCPRPELTERLLRINNAFPDTKIVISSSWRQRYANPYVWESMLYACGGFDLPARICFESPSTPQLHTSRGLEIQAWLDNWEELVEIKKGTSYPPEPIDSFVILDDDTDMEHLMNRLVCVDSEVGLSEKNVEEAIEVLSKPYIKA